MKKFIFIITFTTLLLLPAAVLADTILLNSDLLSEFNDLTSDNVLLPYPHPIWEPNGSDYYWISYADTGYPPPGISHDPWPVNTYDITRPTATFYETFTLPYEVNTGQLTVWADDTAGVFLGSRNSSGSYDYNELIAANWTQGDNCADGPVGCIHDAGFGLDFSDLYLSAGDYQFRFDTYQRGGGPFGLMYSGSITSQPVPEPSTLLLLAAGLGTIGCIVWRRK